MRSETRVLAALASAALALPVPRAGAEEAGPELARIAAVIRDYHRALETGDRERAEALLASDAVILESGALESLEHYLREHLPADIAFARAVRTTRSAPRISVAGTVAWAASTSRAQGAYRGTRVNAQGAELMVLARSESGWKIRAIHWSSRSAPEASP